MTRSAVLCLARFGAVAGALLCAAPALAQRLGQGEDNDVPVWRVLAALLFCLALVAAAAYVMKRRLRGPGPVVFGRARRLQLVETLRLSHQVDLCIIACDGAELLVAATPHGASLIDAPLSSPPSGENGNDSE